jgi:hypothetical protein
MGSGVACPLINGATGLSTDGSRKSRGAASSKFNSERTPVLALAWRLSRRRDIIETDTLEKMNE